MERTLRIACTGARSSLTTLGILGISTRPKAETKIAISKAVHHVYVGVSLMALTRSQANPKKRGSRFPKITAETDARNLLVGPQRNAKQTRGNAATQDSGMLKAMKTSFQVASGGRVLPSVLGNGQPPDVELVAWYHGRVAHPFASLCIFFVLTHDECG